MTDAETIPWELWYQDLFDRETPRQVQTSGAGLLAGLRILWETHLGEGILPDGRPSFSRFNLWLPEQRRSLEIEGEPPTMAYIRRHTLGDSTAPADGPTPDPGLLDKLVAAHAQLLRKGGQTTVATIHLLAENNTRLRVQTAPA